MTSFADVLGSAQALPDGRAFAVPATWHQGRTAYGGFSSALALAEAMKVAGNLADDLPPLRSAQLAMIAPLAGRVEVRARVLRQGRNATWVASEISGDKGVGFTASFVFMNPVESGLAVDDCPVPAGVLAPDRAAILSPERGATFLRNNFDVRFALPQGEQRRPEMCWWVRPREAGGVDPAVNLLLTADALPPGVMRLVAPTVPVSTMHWQVNVLGRVSPTRDGWWLLRSAAEFAQHGCSSQRMSVWNGDGAPVLSGTQSVAVFG